MFLAPQGLQAPQDRKATLSLGLLAQPAQPALQGPRGRKETRARLDHQAPPAPPALQAQRARRGTQAHTAPQGLPDPPDPQGLRGLRVLLAPLQLFLGLLDLQGPRARQGQLVLRLLSLVRQDRLVLRARTQQFLARRARLVLRAPRAFKVLQVPPGLLALLGLQGRRA